MSDKVKAFFEYNPLDKIYESASKAVIKKYSVILPEFFTEIWEKNGFSSYKDGFFWIVNPDEYDDLISQFIHNEGNLHVVMRTAFGGLIYLDEKAKHNQGKDNKLYNYLCPIYLQVTKLTSDLSAVMNGWLTTEEIFSPLMFYNIYSIGRKVLPAPEQNECFGFLPAIALGGDLQPENIKLFKIREHLSFLSQLR